MAKHMLRLFWGIVIAGNAVFLIFISWNIGKSYSYDGEWNTEEDFLEEVQYNIDRVSVDRTSVIISGWAMILGETIAHWDCNVVIQGDISGDKIILPTMMQKRLDLNEVYHDSFDYSNAGFFAQVRYDDLNLEEEDYSIYLEYKTNGHHLLRRTGAKVKKIRETNWQEDAGEGISFSVDKLFKKDGMITIEGWALKEGHDAWEADVSVLLLNGRTGQAYELPTQKIERSDLSEMYFGFTTTIEKWWFDFDYDWHEVCLRYQIEDETWYVHTGEIVEVQ